MARWAASGLLALALLPWLGRWTQPFEVMGHFRMHMAGVTLVAALVWAALKCRHEASLAAAALAIHALAIFLPLTGGAPEGGQAGERVVWANLYRQTSSLNLLADYAHDEQASVIVLTELPPNARNALAAAFPGSGCILFDDDIGDPFAVAIVARRPCTSVGAAPGQPKVRFADIDGLRIVAVHARPPWNNDRTQQRDAAIRAGFKAAATANRAILVGDFNATPWSPVFDKATLSGLKHATCGAPWRPTWKGALGLTIDLAYVSSDLVVADCEVGPDIGSDHRPLVLTLAAR